MSCVAYDVSNTHTWYLESLRATGKEACRISNTIGVVKRMLIVTMGMEHRHVVVPMGIQIGRTFLTSGGWEIASGSFQ